MANIIHANQIYLKKLTILLMINMDNIYNTNFEQMIHYARKGEESNVVTTLIELANINTYLDMRG